MFSNDINLQLREAIYTYRDSSKEIEKALAAGASLEFPERSTSLPPLGIAIITKNNIDLVKLLLAKGASPLTKTTQDFRIDDKVIYAGSDMLTVARYAPVPAAEVNERTKIVQLLAEAIAEKESIVKFNEIAVDQKRIQWHLKTLFTYLDEAGENKITQGYRSPDYKGYKYGRPPIHIEKILSKKGITIKLKRSFSGLCSVEFKSAQMIPASLLEAFKNLSRISKREPLVTSEHHILYSFTCGDENLAKYFRIIENYLYTLETNTQQINKISNHFDELGDFAGLPRIDDEITEFFNIKLPEKIKTISMSPYPSDRDGGLNPALKIFGTSSQNKIENGRWEIFVVLQNEFGKVGLRSGVKSETWDYNDLKVTEQFNFSFFSPSSVDVIKSLLLANRGGHPSLALDFKQLDHGIFRTLPVFTGGWMIRNDDINSQKRLQVYWSSGRYSKDLKQEQTDLLQLCVAFNLMTEYGKDFSVEFYEHSSVTMENFINLKVSGNKAYDWKFVLDKLSKQIESSDKRENQKQMLLLFI